MKGKVNQQREATMQVKVLGDCKRVQSITAVIDTGFDGSLTLPLAIIRALKLKRIANRMCELADGSRVTFDVFAGTVIWNRRRVPVEINQAQTFPLLGMELLDGHALTIHVRPQGRVDIRPLP